MYGNLGMSAETEGGEQHGWLLNEDPVQRGFHPIVAAPVSHAASVKRPALGGRRHFASADGRLGYAGALAGCRSLRSVGWRLRVGCLVELGCLLIVERPGEDEPCPGEEPAVVAVAHDCCLRFLGDASTITTGREVHQADSLDRVGVVGQLHVQSLGRAVDVEMEDMAVAWHQRTEPEGDDDWLGVCDDLGTQVDDIDLPRILHLPRERHRRAVDGELLQGEDLWIGDSQARRWAAVPHTRFSTLGHQLVVALAVGDDGELAEAVPRRDGVLPADT